MGRKGRATTSATSSRRPAGFTLVEILVAFGILTTVVILIAAGMSRSLSAIGVLERSLEAGHLAQHALLDELLQRQQPIVLPEDPLPDDITRQVLTQAVTFDQDPFRGVVMDETRSEVSWTARHDHRTTQLTTALAPQPSSP